MKNRCGEGFLIPSTFGANYRFVVPTRTPIHDFRQLALNHRDEYLMPLAEALFESPTGILRRELQSQPTKIAVPPNQKQLSIYVGSIVNDEQSS